MMLFESIVVAALLLTGHVGPASASGFPKAIHKVSHNLHRRDPNIHAQLRRDADRAIGRVVQRRQAQEPTSSASTATPTPRSGDASTLNLGAWDAETAEACLDSLRRLNGVASNPAGIAVCYNLPFLDNTTGVFEAELRLYNVSAPVDAWAGVTLEDISVTLSYAGAAVQATDNTITRRSIFASSLRKRQEEATPEELKVITYVGRIDSELMNTAPNSAQLQPLLVPSIVLSATNPTNNEALNSSLSSTEASFVTGVFADQSTNTIDEEAQASAAASIVAAAPLPGRSLGIVPIGMYVTLGWTALFLFAVGYGTFGRMQYREQYRRRKRRDLVLAAWKK